MKITAPFIALYSPAPRSGKTEIAKLLVEEFRFERHAFADPIKDMLGVTLARLGRPPQGVTDILVGDLKGMPLAEFGGKTSRFLQELLGETFREKVDPGVWVYQHAMRVTQPVILGKPVVVDDLRRPNEYAYLKKAGATLVKVVRPGAPLDTASNEGLLEGHRFDLTITNDGSLEDLLDKVKRWAMAEVTIRP